MAEMVRWNELRELTRHRALGFLRQPEAVFWVFAFPIILAAVLGFAFQGGKAAPSRVALIEETFETTLEPTAKEELIDRLEADELVELLRFGSREDADLALRNGRVDALLLDPTVDPPRLRLDPARPEAELARLRVLVAVGAVPAESVELEVVSERGSRYVDFLFPGLLGMNVMGTGMWSIGFAVADLRQRKVLKRLLVTPMRRTSFLASFMLSRLLLLGAEVLLLTAFGCWVLGVPLRGNLVQFTLVSVFGAVSFAGLGLLAAARPKTIEGASGMLNLVMMPMWLGCGVFFSYERFPEVVQPVLRLLPLTALNDALRETMLEGAGLASILPEMAVLAAWLVVPFVIALRIFRWA